MNASTSPSPSSSPSLSPSDVAPSSKRNLAFLRPVLSCGGALLMGAVLVRLLPSANLESQTSPVATSTSAPLVLPASQVVRVRRASLHEGKGAILSGEWKLTTDATGRATAAGEVARWVAQPGSHIEAGDSVVEISTGGASRPATKAELLQNKAEQAQVEVAQSQTALAQKLSTSQTQLIAAQDRVAQAQKRVTATRVLVKRLIDGEKIPVVNTDFFKPSRNSTPIKPEVRLTREQTKAIDAASQAQNLVATSKDELDAAQKALTKTRKQSIIADSTLKKVEDDFKIEKTTSDVLQNARADVDDASSNLKEAQTRVDVAQRTYITRQQQAKVAEDAAHAVHTTQAPTQPTPQLTPDVSDDSGKYITADQAATLVASALRESKAATRQADRIHARVEDYQRQVRESSNRAEDVSQDLQQAQQHVLDSVPHATFVSTRAPISGTVTWISRLAREVGTGDSIFGISQGKKGYVHFEDKSPAWKKLRVGQTLDAVSSEPQPAITPVSTSLAMPTSNIPSSTILPTALPPVSSHASPSTAAFSVRITHIVPPLKEGESAQIDATRTDGSGPSNMSGTSVQVELPPDALPPIPQGSQTSSTHLVTVPASVVLPRNGASYVAVLTQTTETVRQSDQTPKEDKEMTLEWRPVEIHSHTLFNIEVSSGLHEGEQLVDQPALLLSQCKPEEKKPLLVALSASS